MAIFLFMSGVVSSGESALVSLVMPVWKPRRKWLLAAVSSALGQTGCPIELVVVDDGCDEPVARMLSSVQDSRLRLIRLPHVGASAARTAGTRAALGQWIRFVDCDDVFPSWSTAHLLDLAADDDRVISYGSTLFCDSELRPTYRYTCDLQGEVVVDCLLSRFTVMLPALLFPRPVIERTGDWDRDLIVSQDWDFVLRALEHAPVRGDRTVVYHYRRHEGSTTSAGGSRGVEAARRIVAKFFERHPEERTTEIGRNAQRMLASLALTQGLAGRQWWRRAEFWTTLVRDPRVAISALPVLVRSSVPHSVTRPIHRAGWKGRGPEH
ncbi:MAG: glycosyltransferase [Gemmatimonadota bacterium]